MRRAGYGVIPLITIGVLALASFLEPSPAGFGTHQALGLPPCFFQKLTGLLCPSCGLTTSFVHLMHGQFLAALQAHPLGPIMLLGLIALAVMSLLEWLGKRTPLSQFLQGHYAGLAYSGLTVFLLVWTGRIFWTHW